MITDEFAWHDATALSALVRNGEVSPLQLVDAAIARIEALDPPLNAVITPIFEQARETAKGALPNGNFRGVPFLLKDLGASLKGVPMSCGSAFLRRHVPDYDSELTTRLKRAGLVILGKTNTPELGIVPTTEPALFGKTSNPWDRRHTAGGSSGGSAAAVAAGMVPMAHANDGGGSIRIPASCCGLFGLKPTRGRNPLGPAVNDAVNDTTLGLVCEHALTRSVRDSAALLDATHGPAVGDPYFAPAPERPFLEEVKRDPKRLTIALTRHTFGGTTLHADAIAAVTSAAELCAELGHHVEEAAPPIGPETAQAFGAVWAASVAASVDGLAQLLGRAPAKGELEPLTVKLAQMGRQAKAHEYLLAVMRLQQMARRVAGFMNDFDVWLTPTLGDPPPLLGHFDTGERDPLAGFRRAFSFTPFTAIANVTGQPAASVPLYWNEAGLPIGAHFCTRIGDEATLFRLSAQLERARPWCNRHPIT